MDIKIPDFLKETENEIHQRMLSNAPSDINIIEGDFFWDATRPTAIEVSNIKNIVLQHLLKLIFLQSTEDIYLDLLAAEYNMTRKPATKAIQIIKVSGREGTTITTDMKVSTKSDDKESIEFQFIESGTIGEEGFIELKAECSEYGIIGNAVPGTITILLTSKPGISAITNTSIYKYAVDKQSDEDFKEELIKYIQEPSMSGNDADYRKWCNEVDGIGETKVYGCWNGNGTVKCIVMSDNSTSVTSEVLDKVYEHVNASRPIGPTITIESATEKNINISATVSYNSAILLTDIQKEFKNKVEKYIKEEIAFKKNIISIAKIGSFLLDCEGVLDYADLKINNNSGNLVLNDNEVPILNIIALE